MIAVIYNVMPGRELSRVGHSYMSHALHVLMSMIFLQIFSKAHTIARLSAKA